ncbi:MAG: hypothetical protein HZB86_07205 [Deltaproteobacteria bacterium]|nr:hypothetical protein [Deltaproteobacteria bacterium]
MKTGAFLVAGWILFSASVCRGEEITYSRHIRPILEERCDPCHGGREDGMPGNMYRNLGVTEEERQKNLKLFKAWVGNWVLKRWPEVTKEELHGIKVMY